MLTKNEKRKNRCVCVCLCPPSFKAPLDHPLRRLGYVSPSPQTVPKDLVIIHSRGSTWADLFRGGLIPS